MANIPKHSGTSRSFAVSSRCLHDSVTAPPCPYLALPTKATFPCLIHLCQLKIPRSFVQHRADDISQTEELTAGVPAQSRSKGQSQASMASCCLALQCSASLRATSMSLRRRSQQEVQ